MNSRERKNHWENVFKTKDTSEVSWYQTKPETSLKLIKDLDLPKSTGIIEIGSGDSFLADFLLQEGYQKITLLDISKTALDSIKKRLQNHISKITFLTQDVLNFNQKELFTVWHDRAVFHFLTDIKEIQKYVKIASGKIMTGGYLIIGTFSTSGPGRCSDLNVRQYSEESMEKVFEGGFKKLRCFTENHYTPSGTVQNFIFCVFQKI